MREQIEADIRGWDAIEDHRTATLGDAETTEWLTGAVREAGAEPQLDTFAFRRVVPQTCTITVAGRSVAGVPLFDGAFTSAKGIEAPLGPVGAAGCIAVCRFDPVPTSTAQPLHQARAGDGHAAIVAVAAATSTVPGLALLNAERFDAPFGPAVLQVASEHAGWLEAGAASGTPARLVAQATFEDTFACNVQAVVPGIEPELAPLVVMTPRSAWWTCTAERGGGIAAWLACLRHLAGARPRRTVIFTANTGHELGHVGLQHYLARQPQLLAGAHAWVHLGANFATRDAAVLYQASDQACMRLGLEALARNGVVPDTQVPVGTRARGEARAIHDGGGRYVSLLGDNRWFHHPDDRWPHSVDLDKTERIVRAVVEMVEHLAAAGEVRRG